MISQDLKREAEQVWIEYGKTICKVFGFNGDIVAIPLLEASQTSDAKKVKKFIEYFRRQTSELKGNGVRSR